MRDRRRLFVAKAERLDTTQLGLEFAHKPTVLDALNQQLGQPAAPAPAAPTETGGARPPGGKRKPTGRRDLREADLPEERIELTAPLLEGSAPRIGWEESCQLAWRRPSPVRMVIARAKYRDADAADTSEPTIVTAPLPTRLLPRALATPSLLAHILSDTFCDDLPFHHQE